MTTIEIEKAKAIIARIFGKEVRYNGTIFTFIVGDVRIHLSESNWTAYCCIDGVMDSHFNGYSLARVCCDMKRYLGNQRLSAAVKEGVE